MILTAHQPAYLPWLGYFDKLIRSDIFIYLDSVQYEKNSFTNRNKIKTPHGELWLTIPVRTKNHMNRILKDIEIDLYKNWERKHLNSIYLNYKKARRFEICYPILEKLYQAKYKLLSDLCFEHLLFWLQVIGIKKNIVKSSELGVYSKKSDLILDLCRYFKADCYISGPLGKNYLEEEYFEKNGIKIEYQNYKHPVYPQLWNDFLPHMSILDFWMNSDEYYLITGENKDEFFKRMG